MLCNNTNKKTVKSVPNIGRSYVSRARSDQSLVSVLRRGGKGRGGRHRETSFNRSTSSRNNSSGSDDSDEDDSEEDSDLDDEDEDDDETDRSEAALTRIHRFCWAICCCCCRSDRTDCCNGGQPDEFDDDEADDLSRGGSEVTAASERLHPRYSNKCCARLDCSYVTIRRKCLDFRNYVRDMVEFAEYGKNEFHDRHSFDDGGRFGRP